MKSRILSSPLPWKKINKDNLIPQQLSIIEIVWKKSSSLLGTDWEWGSQDGGEGSSGVIFKVEDSGIVHVSTTLLPKVTWFEILTDFSADHWPELHCVNLYDILITFEKKNPKRKNQMWLIWCFIFIGKVG